MCDKKLKFSLFSKKNLELDYLHKVKKKFCLKQNTNTQLILKKKSQINFDIKIG